MDRIAITGGTPLKGEIAIAGAKNSALKLMVASLLTDQPLELENVPAVADVTGVPPQEPSMGMSASAFALLASTTGTGVEEPTTMGGGTSGPYFTSQEPPGVDDPPAGV